MADYYAQRAGAGLIITEGTSPSPEGLGYARIPGLFNAGAGRRLARGRPMPCMRGRRAIWSCS